MDGYNLCLQGLHGIDVITPGTSTVAKSKTLILEICEISVRHEQSARKRLNMS